MKTVNQCLLYFITVRAKISQKCEHSTFVYGSKIITAILDDKKGSLNKWINSFICNFIKHNWNVNVKDIQQKYIQDRKIKIIIHIIVNRYL